MELDRASQAPWISRIEGDQAACSWDVGRGVILYGFPAASPPPPSSVPDSVFIPFIYRTAWSHLSAQAHTEIGIESW